jgi:hypothetical protein
MSQIITDEAAVTLKGLLSRVVETVEPVALQNGITSVRIEREFYPTLFAADYELVVVFESALEKAEITVRLGLSTDDLIALDPVKKGGAGHE